MARLILLNGPPGIGKSTLARRFTAAHPMMLCLDVDDIRRSLGNWKADPQSGPVARQLAVTIARQHLDTNHDVIVPQYVGRPEFIHLLETTAVEAGATFHEIVLMDGREQALARFDSRAGDTALSSHHRDALAMAGGESGLIEMYDRLIDLLAGRPKAVIISTTAGETDEAFKELQTRLRQEI